MYTSKNCQQFKDITYFLKKLFLQWWGDIKLIGVLVIKIGRVIHHFFVFMTAKPCLT